jgi:hypothetical protein
MLVKKFSLTEDQADLIQYAGFSMCDHRPCTRVEANDSRWV